MIAPVCQHERRKRFGKTSSGEQRYRCCDCGKTFTESTERYEGMRLGSELAANIIRHLCEGTSVRGTGRLLGTTKKTILDLLLLVGPRCKRFLAEKIHHRDVEEVQCDEIWGFVGMKQKTANRKGLQGEPVGDAYCFTSIERNTKLLVAWHLGHRDDASTQTFCKNLYDGTAGHFHISTDGFQPYPPAIFNQFGTDVDYGIIIKIYGKNGVDDQRKFSPPTISSIKKSSMIGDPLEVDKICTSHIERHNGTIRCFTKRMGRLTYCFSKKWANHDAALALFFAYYNFCKPHASLNVKNGPRRTPAMAAGLTDCLVIYAAHRVW